MNGGRTANSTFYLQRGGYVFVCVCLPVCLYLISRITQKLPEALPRNLVVGCGMGPGGTLALILSDLVTKLWCRLSVWNLNLASESKSDVEHGAVDTSPCSSSLPKQPAPTLAAPAPLLLLTTSFPLPFPNMQPVCPPRRTWPEQCAPPPIKIPRTNPTVNSHDGSATALFFPDITTSL